MSDQYEQQQPYYQHVNPGTEPIPPVPPAYAPTAPATYAPAYQPAYQPSYQPPYQTGYQPPTYWPPAYGPYATPAPWQPTPRRSRRQVALALGLAGALAAALIAVGIEVGHDNSVTAAGVGSSSLIPDSSGGAGSSGSGGGTGTGSGSLPGGIGGSTGGGSTGGGSSSGGSTGSGTATTAQQAGVVDIDTVLQYQSAEAAGTGLVLTSSGEILTNNHVIDGATSIKVTVVTTGKTYAATVVGTDPTADVAVLKLQDASGLTTAKISTSASVAVGDAVTAVGNAGGVGGTPSSASGTVLAVDQSITASDDNGQKAENLTGLIESNAPIQAGDSGGPLYNSAGEIIGIDTAGSSGSYTQSQNSAATQAYSIPIGTAVAVANQIAAGDASATVHLGYPAFLGVDIAATTGAGRFGGSGSSDGAAATISGVIEGSPAAAAGLGEGDTITGVGTTTITSASDLTTALQGYTPGQSVKITWTDPSGQSHSATVKLEAGPAD